ncbi:MAG: hypothetical protein FWC79_07565 [Oscillospiraceae bacterium]|nr:hypothetical protein [Oscillospiraceae bacterium]
MQDTKTKVKFNVLAILLIMIFCFVITPVAFQNDTFYTIRVGEHIVNYGIDGQDQFSWHDLEYTYKHWGYNVFTYFVYSAGGFTGIYIATAILCMILGLAIYFASAKLMNNRVLSLVLTIGVMYMMTRYIAARAQLVTCIFFVLTIYCIEMFLRTKKKRYAIRPIYNTNNVSKYSCSGTSILFYFISSIYRRIYSEVNREQWHRIKEKEAKKIIQI